MKSLLLVATSFALAQATYNDLVSHCGQDLTDYLTLVTDPAYNSLYFSALFLARDCWPTINQACEDGTIPHKTITAWNPQHDRFGVQSQDLVANLQKCHLEFGFDYYSYGWKLQSLAKEMKVKNNRIKIVEAIDLIEPDVAGLNFIIDALKHPYNELETLKFGSSNEDPINKKVANDLAAALADPNCKIKTFEPIGCKLGDGTVTAFAQAMNKLTSLDLSNNPIGDQGFSQLAKSLTHPNNRLASLTLRQVTLSMYGLRELTEALKIQTTN